MPNLNFDAGTAVVVQPDSLCVMAEVYCDLPGTVVKDYPLANPIKVDAVSGTLSFYGLNWPWWKRILRWFGFLGGQSTAICGWIGSSRSNLLAFDIQGIGSNPQLIPVSAVFPSGADIDLVRFNLDADLATPTDFRAALVFHRVKENG